MLGHNSCFFPFCCSQKHKGMLPSHGDYLHDPGPGQSGAHTGLTHALWGEKKIRGHTHRLHIHTHTQAHANPRPTAPHGCCANRGGRLQGWLCSLVAVGDLQHPFGIGFGPVLPIRTAFTTIAYVGRPLTATKRTVFTPFGSRFSHLRAVFSPRAHTNTSRRCCSKSQDIFDAGRPK